MGTRTFRGDCVERMITPQNAHTHRTRVQNDLTEEAFQDARVVSGMKGTPVRREPHSFHHNRGSRRQPRTMTCINGEIP